MTKHYALSGWCWNLDLLETEISAEHKTPFTRG